MENIEQNKDSIPKQENTSDMTTDRLDFLNDEKFSDIKEPLSKTINNLANEHIITPEEDFRDNIEQVTKDIFSDTIFDNVFALKEQQANNIFLFRTKFEKIKEEKRKIQEEKRKENEININNKKQEVQSTKQEVQSTKQEVQSTKQEVQSTKQEIENQLFTKKNELYTQLMTTYETIEDTYKPTPTENLSEKYSEITQKTEFQALTDDEQNNYLKARFAAEKIANEARQSENKTISVDHYNFIQQFNTLDQELNLNSKIDISDLKVERQGSKRPKTMNDIITNDKIGEELVARNKSMEKFVTGESNNIEIENKETIFPLQTIKTKVTERYEETINDTLNDLLWKNNLSQYKDQFNLDGSIKDINTIAESDRENIQTISEKIDKEITTIAQQEQNRLFQETNEVMKTKAVETLVKNIGQYFQVQSFDKKNLAEHVSVDIENGIHLDKNMLTLSANMDGRDIGFYYNIHNGEVRADDFVHLDGENNTKEDGVFYINRDQEKKWREKLPYIKMQTLDQIMSDSKSTIINNSGESLKASKKPETYRNILSDKTNVFSPKESSLGKDIIEHTMEKNTAVHNIHDFITKYMPTRNTYNQQTEKYEYNVYRIIDTTFDRYTAEEIKTRNNLFQRFQNKVNEKNPTFKDPLIRSLFDETTANKQKEEHYDQEKGPNIYQFLQGITNENGSVIKEQVINLNLFEQIVNELERVNGNTDKLKDKSNKYKKLRNDFEEEKTKNTADNDLDLNNEQLRGPSIKEETVT